jgi:hypothetical protein
MKHLRHFCAATALTCVFAQATWADDGIIHGGVVPPPPPPPASAKQADDPLADEQALLDPVTALAVTLVQNMISLF